MSDGDGAPGAATLAAPKPGGFICETPLRVRYAETDAMGIVHHSAYVIWFEAGRSDWLRQRGTSYGECLEAAGIGLPVVELVARYLAPARYDELVVVRTWVAELKSRRIRFGYEVVGSAGQRLVEGETAHLCVGQGGQVMTLPVRLRELIGEAAGL